MRRAANIATNIDENEATGITRLERDERDKSQVDDIATNIDENEAVPQLIENQTETLDIANFREQPMQSTCKLKNRKPFLWTSLLKLIFFLGFEAKKKEKKIRIKKKKNKKVFVFDKYFITAQNNSNY